MDRSQHGSRSNRNVSSKARDDELLLEMIATIERVENDLQERRIDHDRTREIIDLVERLLGQPPTKDDLPGS